MILKSSYKNSLVSKGTSLTAESESILILTPSLLSVFLVVVGESLCVSFCLDVQKLRPARASRACNLCSHVGSHAWFNILLSLF